MREGFDGLVMLNLFAFRATDPKVMKAARDPVGPDNDKYLLTFHQQCALTVAGWGVHGTHLARAFHVRGLLGKGLKCLGKSKGGHPKHPLYLAADTPLVDL